MTGFERAEVLPRRGGTFHRRAPLRDRRLEPLPESWEDARERLVLEPIRRSWALAARLAGLDPHEAIVVELDPSVDLLFLLCIDVRPEAVPVLTYNVRAWGVSEDEAIAAARHPLGHDLDRPWVDEGEGLFRSPWGSKYDAARLLTPDLVEHLPAVRGAPLFVVDAELGLFLLGDADPVALSSLVSRRTDSDARLLHFGAGAPPAIGHERPIRFRDGRFESVPFGSVDSLRADVDFALVEIENVHFALLAKAHREGVELGAATSLDDSPPPGVAFLELARPVEFIHYHTDSEYRAAGLPIPHEPAHEPVLVLEADVFDADVVVPASADLLLVTLPPAPGAAIRERRLVTFGALAELPTFECKVFEVAGLPLVKIGRVPWDEAHRVGEPFASVPPNWEGPRPIAALGVSSDDPDPSAFAEPLHPRTSSGSSGAAMRVFGSVLVVLVAIAAYRAFGDRCPSPRSMHDDWREMAALAELLGRPTEAGAFRHFADEALHRRYIRSVDMGGYLGAEPFPDDVENRLRALAGRSDRAARCLE